MATCSYNLQCSPGKNFSTDVLSCKETPQNQVGKPGVGAGAGFLGGTGSHIALPGFRNTACWVSEEPGITSPSSVSSQLGDGIQLLLSNTRQRSWTAGWEGKDIIAN